MSCIQFNYKLIYDNSNYINLLVFIIKIIIKTMLTIHYMTTTY